MHQGEHSDSIYVYLYRLAATIHTKHARPCTSMQAHAHRTDRHQRVHIIYAVSISTTLLSCSGDTEALLVQQHLSRKQQAQYHCGIYTNNKHIPTTYWLHRTYILYKDLISHNYVYVYVCCVHTHT